MKLFCKKCQQLKVSDYLQNCFTIGTLLGSKCTYGTRNSKKNRKLRLAKMSEIKTLKENFRILIMQITHKTWKEHTSMMKLLINYEKC